jgi:hypothetical protein
MHLIFSVFLSSPAFDRFKEKEEISVIKKSTLLRIVLTIDIPFAFAILTEYCLTARYVVIKIKKINTAP